MIHLPTVPDNSEAELRAFEAVCGRLQGFDADVSAESIDAFLCAVAAGPRPAAPGEWLPALVGDTWGRVFADPQDDAQALAALERRLSVLRAQLDAEALLDDPDALRLAPWMSEWTDADRERARAEGPLTDEQAAELQTGAWWAQSFLAAVQRLPHLWSLPPGAEAAFDDVLDVLVLVAAPPGGDVAREIGARLYPDGVPARDQLIDALCMAVQDLRLLWLDHAPKTETRRVAAAPGRNDLCPCGSGKKYKKCCGAAA